MNSRGETKEQLPVPDTVGLCAEHAALGVAVAGLTAAAIALTVEHTTSVVVLRGGYSIVAAMIVIGFTGWIVGAAERRIRRDLGGAAAELTAELAELRAQVQSQRIVYLPAPGRQGGHLYVSGTAAQGVTVPTQPNGLDAETIAAARRISDRLHVVDNN